MSRRFCDSSIAVYVPPFLDIQSATVSSVDAGYNLSPSLWLNQMEKPQPAPLVITIRLTDTHIPHRYPSLIHAVIQWIRRKMFVSSVIGPKVCGLPIVNRVDVIQSRLYQRSPPLTLIGFLFTECDCSNRFRLSSVRIPTKQAVFLPFPYH